MKTLQESDASSVSTAAGVPQPPGTLRKKRITKRVGYARDADDEDASPPKAKQPASPGQSQCQLFHYHGHSHTYENMALQVADNKAWSCAGRCMTRGT